MAVESAFVDEAFVVFPGLSAKIANSVLYSWLTCGVRSDGFRKLLVISLPEHKTTRYQDDVGVIFLTALRRINHQRDDVIDFVEATKFASDLKRISCTCILSV